MDLSAAHRKALRDELAGNLNGTAAIRMICEDAGLNVSRINLSGAPEIQWHNVLNYADRQGPKCLAALLQACEERYPILAERVGPWFFDYSGTQPSASHSKEAAQSPSVNQGAAHGAEATQQRVSGDAGKNAPTNNYRSQGKGRGTVGQGKPVQCVLFAAANTNVDSLLALNIESQQIQASIEQGDLSEQIDLDLAMAIESSVLRKRLRKKQPVLLHFSGHGTENGQLILHRDQDRSVKVQGAALAQLLRLVGTSVRVVVLNACWADTAAEALLEVVDCVIGTTRALPDSDALRFSEAFYESLSYGENLQKAFELGSNAAHLNRAKSSDLYRIRIKDGVDASQLFLFSEPDEAPEEPVKENTASGNGGGGFASPGGHSISSKASNLRNDVYEKLCRLSPSVLFDDVEFRANIPSAYRSSRSSNQRERAAALVEYMNGQGGDNGLQMLQDLIVQVQNSAFGR